MRVSEHEFRRRSLLEPNEWEFYDGRLYRKQPMTFAHNDLAVLVGHTLLQQLVWDDWVVRIDAGLVRRSASRYYIPDVMVIPRVEAERLFPDPNTWEVYSDPIALVVEVWSPSTGAIDRSDKLRDYQRRGDFEIWLLHPIERTLRAWVRQDGGSYRETLYSRGLVVPSFLPGVSIDLDELFHRLK